MKAFVATLLGALFCCAGVCRAQDVKPGAAPADTKTAATPRAKNPLFDRATPEGALRMFFAGMMLGSREVLDATTLPVSEEDMQILLLEPKGIARPTMDVVKRICGEMKIRRLKVGEKFTMPGGKVITVGADEIADDLAVLYVEGDPFPTRLGMARGQWWVNAGPIIAGRKAGQAAMKKEAEAKAAAKPKEDAK